MVRQLVSYPSRKQACSKCVGYCRNVLPASKYADQPETASPAGGKCGLPRKSQNVPQHLIRAATHCGLRSQLVEIADLLLQASNIRIRQAVSALSATLAILALGPEGDPSPWPTSSRFAACADALPTSDPCVDSATSLSANMNASCGHISAVIISPGRMSARSTHLAAAVNQGFAESCFWATSSVISSTKSRLPGWK